MEMKISFFVSPTMIFVPEHVLHGALESVRWPFLSFPFSLTYS